MRKCWAHSPEVRPSFRNLKEQLVNVNQGLLNDWLSLLRCLRFSSPSSAGSGRNTLTTTTASIHQSSIPRSPFFERSLIPSTLALSSNNSTISSSYNSATLPASHRHRSNVSLPSATELLQLSSTLCRSSFKRGSSRDSSRDYDRDKLIESLLSGSKKRDSSLSSASSSRLLDDDDADDDDEHDEEDFGEHHEKSHHISMSQDNCDICSSYGSPWIEICKAIRASKGKYSGEWRNFLSDDSVVFFQNNFFIKTRLYNGVNDADTVRLNFSINPRAELHVLFFIRFLYDSNFSKMMTCGNFLKLGLRKFVKKNVRM